jgi:hypothetical protein
MRREAAGVEFLGWASLAILTFLVFTDFVRSERGAATVAASAGYSVDLLLAAGIASAGRVLRALVRARAFEPHS